MTSEQRRQALHARGYVVMRRPFRAGSVFCMRRADHVKGGPLYSIDLESGRWNRWGVDRDGVWHAWVELTAAEPHTSDIKTLAQSHNCEVAQGVQPFVDQCVAAGFSLLPPRESAVPSQNRFARYDGRLYLICPTTRCIVDRRFDKHTLDEFRPRAAETVHTVQGAVPAPASPEPADGRIHPSAGPARPFVSLREQPVTLSGRNRQPSLF